MDNKIIETFNLTKKYKLKGTKKEILALNNINIDVKEGEIFGLLGPNGAGKTTLISILTTLLQPTSGYAIVNGYNILKNPNKSKTQVALMLESDMLYYRITAYDNLKFFCKIYNVSDYKEKINKMVKLFGLEKWLNQYVENFSSGMKMKLALCKTLLLERKILFLDEPTLGLDVKSILHVIDILKDLHKTIFLTSHDMNVVDKLCNRIAFINKGNILKIGTKDDIKQIIQNEIVIEITISESENKNILKSELTQQESINEVIDSKKGLIVSLKSRDYYKDLLFVLSNYKVLKIMEQDLNLEDLFIKLI